MPSRLPENVPQVSARIHYLVAKGVLPLPVREHAQIVLQKFEIQTLLKCLVALYIRNLCNGAFVTSENLLNLIRGAQEPCFESLFDQYGYPDEIEPLPETREWLALSEACGQSVLLPPAAARALCFDLKSSGAGPHPADRQASFPNGHLVWKSDPNEVESWKRLIKMD